MDKETKSIFKILGATFIAGGIFFMIPFSADFLIRFAENFILHRNFQAVFVWKLRIFCSAFALIILGASFLAEYFGADFSQKTKKFCTTRNLIFACGIFSASIFIFPFLSGDIWYDESFSLALVSHKISQMISLTNRDVHPPLYYFILKFAMKIFGTSTAAAKFVSVVPCVLSIFVVSIFLKKKFSLFSAAIFVLLFVSSGTLAFSYEIRMYSWAQFFVALCSIFSCQMIFDGRKRFFVLYGISASLAAYTQYYAAVVLVFHALMTFCTILHSDKNSLKKILLTIFTGALIYLPQVPVVVSQFSRVAADYWIAPVTIRNLAEWGVVLFGFGGGKSIFTPLIFLFCVSAFFKIFCSAKKNKFSDAKENFLLIQLFSPALLVIFAVTVSVAIRPMFVSRYLVPSAVLLFVFLSAAAADFVPERNRIFCALILLSAFPSTYLNLWRNEKFSAQKFSEMKKIIDRRISDETQFLYCENDGHSFGTLSVLYPKNLHFIKTSSALMKDVFVNSADAEKIYLSRPVLKIFPAEKFDFENSAQEFFPVNYGSREIVLYFSEGE
jgi:hypothetical protein